MNLSPSSRDNVLFPVTISVTAETVRVLAQIAEDMGISVADVLSVLAEDAVIDLESKTLTTENVLIPDKCSREDLLKRMNNN